MRIAKEKSVVDTGTFSDTAEWESGLDDIRDSIFKVTWPDGSDDFTIHPETESNGVRPITARFDHHLEQHDDWWTTGRIHFKTVMKDIGIYEKNKKRLSNYFDDVDTVISSPWFDALKGVGEDEVLVVEWETGNISSTHRSLNRIALGLITGIIQGGVVIMPTRNLYRYLTDRVGNYQEIEPYLLIWESLEPAIENGAIKIIAVEHDSEDMNVRSLPKGSDGMSDRDISDYEGYSQENLTDMDSSD